MSLRYWNLEVAARNNPKILAAGKDAFALWCLCSLYSAEQLTDGFVPQMELDRLVRDWKLEGGLQACLSSLVPGRGPLLDKVDGGVRVHDYLDYNPSGDYMKRLSRERRAAGQKGAMSRHSGKCQKQVPEASDSGNGIVRPSVSPSVSPSVGSETDSQSSELSLADRIDLAYRREWEAVPGHSMARPAPAAAAKVAAWASSEGLDLDAILPAIRWVCGKGKGLALLPSVFDEVAARQPRKSDDSTEARSAAILNASPEALYGHDEPPRSH